MVDSSIGLCTRLQSFLRTVSASAKKRRLGRYVAASAHMLLTLMRQSNSVESWSVSDRHTPGDNASSRKTHY